MSFDWSEFYKLAQELIGRGNVSASREAKLRSAISRAYFAAHCSARNHLVNVDRDTVDSDNRAHKQVVEKFKSSTDKERIEIGESLNRLRQYRGRADYDDTFGFTDLEKTAQGALMFGGLVLNELKNLPPSQSPKRDAR